MENDAPKLKPWILWTVMLALLALVLQIILETGVQLAIAKRSGVWGYLADFREAAQKESATLEQYSKKLGLEAYLGWGKAESRISGPPNAQTSTGTVLIAGDSVSQGMNVKAGEEDYPALLANRLNAKVVNLSVKGYGVDQMWLKLLTTAGSYHPQAIVFAYIPHDLVRPAADFNFGLPKPKFAFAGPKPILNLAVPVEDYHQSYDLAKSGFHLSWWYAAYYWNNREFYLPNLYTDYYRRLYRHIGEGLAKLSEELAAPVLVAKLTNRRPFRGQDTLSALAATELVQASGWGKADVRYVDTDECIASKALAAGVAVEQEFAFHPGVAGHQMLAECLAGHLDSLLRKR